MIFQDEHVNPGLEVQAQRKLDLAVSAKTNGALDGLSQESERASRLRLAETTARLQTSWRKHANVAGPKRYVRQRIVQSR